MIVIKKIIICNSIDELNGIKAKKLMSIAKFHDFESLFERGRPKIQKNRRKLWLVEML